MWCSSYLQCYYLTLATIVPMSESSWESSRKSFRKKIIFSAAIVFPFLLVSSILFINNRDLITKTIEPKSVSAESSSRESVQETEKKTEKSSSTSESSSSSGDILKKTPVEKIEASPLKESIVPEQQKKSVKAVKDHTEKKQQSKSFSERLAPIRCRIENRKDVVINLSLELFFNDPEKRAAIRLRREDIKIMVWRTMRLKELSEIKIGELEKQLFKEINSIFEVDDLNSLKIRNIHVEKVAQ